MQKTKLTRMCALLLTLCLIWGAAGCAGQDASVTAADYLSLGEKYLLVLDYEQAVVQFLQVVEIEPKNPRGYTGAAEAYIALGDVESAIEILRQGLEQLPEDTGIQALLKGQLAEAYITIQGARYSTDLTELDLSGLGLTNADIEPLRYMTNLRRLHLGRWDEATQNYFGNEISDISVLANLTNLTSLSISANNIRDINALAALSNLGHLDLTRNQISDISALSGLTKLTFLSLAINNISDISALSGLSNLTTLHLSSNNISDISALSGLTNLTTLGLNRNNNIADWSPVAHISHVDGRL